MTSQLAAPPDLQGAQRPRISCHPLYVSSAGQDTIDLAAEAGLYLDDWQQYVLCDSLGERSDGKWAAFEVGIDVPRQNGKGGILEARELGGLFLFREDLIIHSAHEFATSMEAFNRMVFLIENTPDLFEQLQGGPKGIHRSHGEEGFTLKGGQRLRYKTRTGGGGRGFTCDCLVIDEAYNMPRAKLAAILPTLSAVPNPQIWYTSSAVDQQRHPDGVVFAQVRERGIAGTDPRLAYFEWSADLSLDQLTDDDLSDPRNWAQANPGLGIRIPAEFVEWERRGPLGRRGFACERLGVGDWPRTDEEAQRLIPTSAWDALADVESAIEGEVRFAFDVAPDRSSSAIAASGYRSDGLPHVGIVFHDRGTAWVPQRLAELVKRFRSQPPVCDAIGPAAALLSDLDQLGIEAETTSAQEYAQACGMFFDAVMDSKRLRHAGTAELGAAIDGAATAPLADSWKWSRKHSSADITPLVAATLALWGRAQPPKQVKSRAINLNAV